MPADNPSDDELRLLAVLRAVCNQYMPGHRPWLDHECMSAGEHAVEALSNYGLVEADGRGGVWTTKALLLDRLDDIERSNMDEIRSQFSQSPAGEPIKMPDGSSPLSPDLNIFALRLWFTGLAKRKPNARPAFWPELEADRLDVIVRTSLVNGSFLIAGELLTLRDLEKFKVQLEKLSKKKRGRASLRGTRNSVVIELHKTAIDKIDTVVSLAHPHFQESIRASRTIKYQTEIEGAVRQLDTALQKFS